MDAHRFVNAHLRNIMRQSKEAGVLDENYMEASDQDAFLHDPFTEARMPDANRAAVGLIDRTAERAADASP